LEEQRIGIMYLNLFKRWLAGIWDGMFPRGFRRSSALPVLAATLFIVLPIVAWMLHRAGKFGTLKREIKGENQEQVVQGPMPGGMEPIVLKLGQSSGSNRPEFRSATILPGLGMEVLQIVAYIPGKGEVELLASPSVKQIAEGNTPMRVGSNDRWGALEAPWSGLLTGLPTPVGMTLRALWRGRTVEVPANEVGHASADGGMLNSLAADAVQVTPTLEGSSAIATFKATDFAGHWTSRTDLAVTVTLDPRTIELTVVAKNVGDQPEPMGIGWHPRFVLPNHNRDGAQLRLPGGEQMEIADRSKGLPSGKFIAPTTTLSRFQIRPTAIGLESIDYTLVHLKPGLMDSAVSGEIRDPVSEFGLRMTAAGDSIRELRVASPGGSSYVSLGMQTNLDDPLGKEWTGADSPSIPVLLPGQTAQWKIRLEIFAISGTQSAAP